MWALGGSVYAALELLGPLAIDKQPLRYLALPSLLVTAGALLVLAGILADVRTPRARFAVVSSVAVAATFLFVMNLDELRPNGATAHYHDACATISNDLKLRRCLGARGRALVASEVPQPGNLVWYGLACRVYSNYGMGKVRYVARDVDVSELRSASAAYYVAWREPDRLPAGIRWKRLDAATTVFVAEQDHPSMGTARQRLRR